MRYSVQLRDRIFRTGCRFLSFAKMWLKSIGKSISKRVSTKQANTARNFWKLSQKLKNAAEATGDLIVNKITDGNTKNLKSSNLVTK